MWRIAKWLAVLLVCKTTISIISAYGSYFPPNFRSDFLLGREHTFFGTYSWAFYSHLISGPFVLLLGLVLLNESFRRHFPKWHRRLGRVQVACVVFLLAPSGLWMAGRAATGMVAGSGFATLAIATAGCALLGWRAAIQGRFTHHRAWMLRCFVLLCAAVVLRLIGGVSELIGLEGTYPFAAWLSWLVPLILLESMLIRQRRSHHRQ